MRRKLTPSAPSKPSDIHLRIIRSAVVAGCVTGLYEIVRIAQKPGIEMWVSHVISTLFVALLVAAVSFWALSKDQGLQSLVAATEEHYQLLFERSLAGVYRTTLDGRIIDCNVSFCRILGYTTREEVIGKCIEAGYPNPADHGQFIARLRAEKTLENFAQRLRRVDGSIITVLNSATLVEEGSQPFVKGTLTHITELKDAEQEQRRLAAIVRCSEDAIISLTLEGKIETWNAGAERIFGYSVSEITGQSIAILAPDGRQKEFLRILEGIANGHEEHRETIRRRKDGRCIDVALSSSPITDAAGNVIGCAAIVQDITERKAAERALQKSEDQYRLLFDSNPVPMWVFDRSTLRFLAVNKAAIWQYGYSEQEFMSMTIIDIRPESDIPELLKGIEKRPRGLQRRTAWKHRRKDGSIIDVEIVGHNLDFHGKDAELIAAFDVTEQKKAYALARDADGKYRGIFENAVLGIFQGTPNGRPTAVNQALATMHGYNTPEEMLADVSNVAQQLFVDPNRIIELSRTAVVDGVVRGEEVEVYRKDRSRFWTKVNLRAVRDAAGDLVSIEGTVEDITDRKAAEARIQHLAYYDALTDLPNSMLFLDRLAIGLAGARRRNEKVALLFLDLDRFTIINDSLGRSAGDQILQEIAKRLQQGIREQDTIARIESDEFGILLNAVHDFAAAGVTAGRLMELLALPFVIQGRTVSLGCSIGISVFPQHGADADSLIKNAEAAMHCAKDEGRNSFRFFAEAMNGKVAQQLALELGLRKALANHEFFLVYQPEVNLATGRMIAMEALIRWRHPELGLVPPDQFIRIAENSGLILPIGEWVLRTACSQLQEWRSRGLSIVPVAVNVSAVQFRNNTFCSLVQEVLRIFDLPAEYLELELTEGALLSNAVHTSFVLTELKSMGVRVAIDDFGTGYSSLSYLKQFQVDKLKIDRSFVRDLPADGDNAAITTAIISMAKSLNLSVIGEGVETKQQLTFLREQQCDEVQGYYFSKPITSDEMTTRLESFVVDGINA